MSEFRQPDRARHPDGVHRDQYKRPIYWVPDDPDAKTKCRLCDVHVPGRPFTRVTRFIDVLDDKFRLEKWFQRQIAKGLALKEHLVLRAANSLNADDPRAEQDALDKVCDEAADAAGAHDQADRGSELHRTIEKIIRGERVQIPSQYQADIEALHDKLSEHRATAFADDLETNVVLDGVSVTKTAWGIGGRFDLTLTMSVPCPTCGLNRRLSDFKTGRVDYGADKFRAQLAAYALSKKYDVATGQRGDLNVCQCIGYVIHLPAGQGRCEVLEADLERGRQGLWHAFEIWRWRSGNAELPPAAPPAVDDELSKRRSTPDILGLISVAADQLNIAGLYEHFAAEGLWTEEHTAAAWRRIAELEGAK